MSEDASTSLENHPASVLELEDLAGQLTEFQHDTAEVLQAARELAEKHALKAEFFADSTRSFFLLALAQRLIQVRSLAASAPEKTAQEETFINSALPLLALDKSAHYDSNKPRIFSVPEKTPEEQREAYDNFTNPELTTELQAAIDSGLLDELKARLGIDPSAEKPFVLKVLRVGDSYTARGLEPTTPQEAISYPETEAWQAYDQEFTDFRAYVDDLERNADDFSAKVGGPEAGLKLAWISKVGDDTYLGLAEPVARKILHPESIKSDLYKDDDLQRDFAFLEHEYVHTQKPLGLDSEPFFGMMMEERRAEYFSGDKNGYLAVKAFFMDLQIITGFDTKDWLEITKSTDRTSAYVAMANQLGLQTVLEVALSAPKQYLTDERPLQNEVAHHLGGPNRLLHRQYEAVVAQGRQAELQARLQQVAKKVIEDGVGVQQWANIRREIAGLNFVADMVEAEVAKVAADN